MPLTVASLRAGIAQIGAHLATESGGLSALDGQLGDGDLGVTLSKAFVRLNELGPELPNDLGGALAICATAISKVSSSSFGTLMAVSCLATSKTLRGKTELPWSEVPALLAVVADTVASRGKAQLGQKTVLDAIDAAARAMQGGTDPGAMLAIGLTGVRQALDGLRDKPAQIGRARIFAEKSRGLDDPGMKAFEVMLAALSHDA
jgi:phosphoenolpyruvate---glycerone phosphotransferase subunit DhaL